MIVIPPQDPADRPPDPAAEALGQLYDQFTNVQNLGEFHAALRKRDTLYEVQHQEMSDNPQDFENLHPRDFYRQFDRRAEENDKTVLSEAPYRIRQQLRDVLWAERDAAKNRALESYKKLFIDHKLAQLDQDRQYYLGKIAAAANDQDRERYTTALIGRLKLSGDVGLLYKDDADRLIDNIPSDYDIFNFNREFAHDPERAQRLLLYGAYPNIRPELRDELVKAANDAAVAGQQEETPSLERELEQPPDEAGHGAEEDPPQEGGRQGLSNDSETNKIGQPSSKDEEERGAGPALDIQESNEPLVDLRFKTPPNAKTNAPSNNNLQSVECPENPRCRPAAEWNKYFPKMPQPKVKEKTGILGAVVFPDGSFIPPPSREGPLPKNPDIADPASKVLIGFGQGDKDFWEIRPPDPKKRYLTWGEATWQWRYGNGKPITVDLNKLDLSGIHPEDFSGPGAEKHYTFSNKDMYVHGEITLVMNKDGTVSAKIDTYNFDRKLPYTNYLKRNLMNEADIIMSGPGKPFTINFNGSVKLQPRPKQSPLPPQVDYNAF
jgi:hypothetical protein